VRADEGRRSTDGFPIQQMPALTLGVVLLLLPTGGCLHTASIPAIRARRDLAERRAGTPLMLDDAELMASLRARLETDSPVPLGIDDVGADSMGPSDVISRVMEAMRKGDFVALLGFSVKADGSVEDPLGQLSVGAFGSADELRGFLAKHERYSTLTKIEEWKPMGPPDMSSMSRKAAQKLLVKRDGGNWEDLFINMQVFEPVRIMMFSACLLR